MANINISMSDAELKQVSAKIREFEGGIEHIYRDTKGKATVGVGHYIPNIIAVTKIPFIHRRTRRIANFREKQQEYRRVMQMPYGKQQTADKFDSPNALILTIPYMEYQVKNHLITFYQELKKLYPNLDTFPVEAKMALFDMPI